MASFDYDVLFMGSGPGGYVGAIRAAQLGKKVAVVERDKPGGVCLNIGCIPSKALINQADIFLHRKNLEDFGVKLDMSGFDYRGVYRKSRSAAGKLSKGVSYLLKKNSVDYVEGDAKISGVNEVTVSGEQALTAESIVIATGSRPREIPGFEIDEERVLSSTGALMLQELPKRMVVLGGGYIGMELAFVMNAFGVETTVVEMLPEILPYSDPDNVAVARNVFERRGMKILTGRKALKLEQGKNGLSLTTEQDGGGSETLEADKLLVAVGRVPNTEGIGLENVGIRPENGFVPVKDYYRTSIPSIYAIGDVVEGTPPLAHVASKEGEIVAETLAGHAPEPRVDTDLVPAAVYCEPQVAGFGPTEQEASERGISYRTAVFPYRGAGKSVAIEHSEGQVKILYEAETSEIVAAHVVGKDATELVHELLLAKRSELLPTDIATTIHAHPTLSEAVMEAARAAEGWAIHA